MKMVVTSKNVSAARFANEKPDVFFFLLETFWQKMVILKGHLKFIEFLYVSMKVFH